MEALRHLVASNIIVLERISNDNGDIEALAENIKKEGLHNPIHVIKNNRGQYVLLAGEKRLKAVMLLGEQQIAVKVIDTKVKPENFYAFHRNYQIIEERRIKWNKPVGPKTRKPIKLITNQNCGHILIKTNN